jgi:endonuclease/exonuclease/phosphatase family metal-dependent hydrolase
VENLALLERLAAGPLAGGGYSAFLREGLDPRGIDVGVLARVPVAAYVSHLDERSPGGARLWSRDLVEVHLEPGPETRPLVVLGNHLVSRLDPAADARRREQAARVREVADALRAGADRPAVLVVGDLNDLPDSPALAPLLADGAFVDLGASLPQDEAWTWSGGGARERIDYALSPHPDAAAVTSVGVVSGADVAAASDHRPLVVDLWLAGAP